MTRIFVLARPQGGCDVGMRKIVALEQQRLPALPGQGIGEAIAEVRPCRAAAALAEVATGRARDPWLGFVDGLDGDADRRYQIIKATAYERVPPAIDDDSGFKKITRRHA